MRFIAEASIFIVMTPRRLPICHKISICPLLHHLKAFAKLRALKVGIMFFGMFGPITMWPFPPFPPKCLFFLQCHPKMCPNMHKMAFSLRPVRPSCNTPWANGARTISDARGSSGARTALTPLSTGVSVIGKLTPGLPRSDVRYFSVGRLQNDTG